MISCLFQRPKRRRVVVAEYPDGQRFIIRRRRFCGEIWWEYQKGSCRESLAGAKAEAKALGATIKTELR